MPPVTTRKILRAIARCALATVFLTVWSTSSITGQEATQKQEEPKQAGVKSQSGEEAKGQETKPGAQEEKGQEEKKTDEPDPEDPLAGMDDDEDFPDDPPEETEAEPGLFETWIRLGKFKLRERLEFHYRRMTSKGFVDVTDLVVPRRTERDQEFRSVFEVETFGIGGDNINSYVNLDYRKDLDGTSDPSFHKNILTSYSSHDLLRLNSLWVEAVDVFDHLKVRIGRQSLVEAHPVTFDGVSTVLDRFRLFRIPAEFRAFGGVMVSDFANLRQDFVFGGGLLLRPARNLAFELRDTRYTRNRLEAEARWEPLDNLSLLGMYGFYDAKGRDSRIEVRYVVPGLGLDLTVGHYERFAADFRLDFLTGQPSRRLDRRFLLLPELAPFRETYVRAEQPLTPWLLCGAEFIRHVLRNGDDQSAYDTDYNQWNGYLDVMVGPARLRSEMRYYHANREPFPLVVPRFPSPTVLVNTRQGERDHIEYHLHGAVTIADGWRLSSGFTWHRVNYIDSLAEVEHEQFADFRAELSAQLQKNVTLRMTYDHTRDAEYFSPYFERFQAFSWILDIRI